MAQTQPPQMLDTPQYRQLLARRREPYWTAINKGLSLGYRKGASSGTWIARHFSATRKPKMQYCSLGVADGAAENLLSYEHAREAAIKWGISVRPVQPAAPSTDNRYDIAQAFEDYLSWFRVHRKSITDTEQRIRALILPTLGNIEVDKITAQQIRNWHSSIAAVGARLRTARGHAPRFGALDTPDAVRRRRSTANRTLTILKACLNYAWREGKIQADDAWRRVRGFPNVSIARQIYLTIHQGRQLLEATRPPFRQLAHAALLTGARYGELIALKVRDFDGVSETIRISTSKSGKARHIVLNGEGTELFRWLTSGRNSTDAIFLTANGCPWRTGFQKRPMQRACRIARIEPPVTFHSLRHTWASLSLMSGATHMVVAQNLGHVDTRMVEKHYGHLAQSYVADMIRKTAPAFGRIEDSHSTGGT